MEPSDFNYADLKNQRDNGAYDNFLRSNIDNEQDKRNFVKEEGRDMLPFRSYEAAVNDASNTVKTKIGTLAIGTVPGAVTATPGTPFLVPLRWNNPHASEIEVAHHHTHTSIQLHTTYRHACIPVQLDVVR